MRAERKHPLWYVIVVASLLWTAILLACVSAAHAQTGGFIFSAREQGQPHGEYLYCWNSTGVLIQAGTIVQADTISTGSVPQVVMGKAIKTWTGATTDYGKIIGVLLEPAPTGFGWARVMVRGFLPNGKMMSGVAAGSYIRPSFTAAGRFAAWTANDSTNQYRRKQCGVFQRYAATDSAIGYVWVDFPPR